MSRPRSLELPSGCLRAMITTARGDFAALQMPADAGVAPRPPALLVPGYTGSKEDFVAVLAPLAGAGHTVTAIDLRGQYETPGSDDPTAYELDELAADLLAIIDTLGGVAHMVGHSYGGFVARAAAALDGNAVGSLTLLGSGPGEVTGEGTRLHLAMLAAVLPEHDMETIGVAKRAIELERGDAEATPEVEAFLHERFVRTHPLSLAVAADQLGAAVDRAAPLADLRVPLLVLYGSDEDVWSAAELAAMAQRAGVAGQMIEGAGHSPAVDDPDATAAALIGFWARADAVEAPVTRSR